MCCTVASVLRIASNVNISGCDGLTSLSRYAPIRRRCRMSGWLTRFSKKSIDRFMRPVCSGAMYASVPAIVSGGSGACRSRGRSDAIPKPVSQTLPDVLSTVTLAGLTSRWMIPRSWSLPSAFVRPMLIRRNAVRFNGRSRAYRATGRPDLRAPTSSAPSPERAQEVQLPRPHPAWF